MKTITSIIRICLYHSCFRGGAVHPTSPNGQLGKFFFKISRNIWSGEFHNDDRVRPNDIALGVEERVHTTHIKYSIEFQFFSPAEFAHFISYDKTPFGADIV